MFYFFACKSILGQLWIKMCLRTNFKTIFSLNHCPPILDITFNWYATTCQWDVYSGHVDKTQSMMTAFSVKENDLLWPGIQINSIEIVLRSITFSPHNIVEIGKCRGWENLTAMIKTMTWDITSVSHISASHVYHISMYHRCITFFCITGLSHISALHIYRIFLHHIFITYFSITYVSHISASHMYHIFQHHICIIYFCITGVSHISACDDWRKFVMYFPLH